MVKLAGATHILPSASFISKSTPVLGPSICQPSEASLSNLVGSTPSGSPTESSNRFRCALESLGSSARPNVSAKGGCEVDAQARMRYVFYIREKLNLMETQNNNRATHVPRMQHSKSIPFPKLVLVRSCSRALARCYTRTVSHVKGR
jgi:hypothetical protein